MLDRIDQQMNILRTVANLRASRQELLASNIANADTPHYKARDFDFQSALKTALTGRGNNALALTQTSSRHLAGSETSPIAGALRYRTEFQAAVDGNTVNMDVERSAFTENAMQLEASLTFIRERFRGLQSAIQGQ